MVLAALFSSLPVQQLHAAAEDTKPTEPTVADPWNSRLSVDVGADGRYSVGAFPDPSTGDPTTNSFKLLYGWPNTGTTYSTLRIDGADAILGQDAPVTDGPTDSGDTDTTTFGYGAVTTTQTLRLVTNPQTGQPDAVRIAYRIANSDTVSHEIGVRAMLDTDVNDNDGAPFRIPGIGAITTEQDLSGSAVPDTFQVFQDLGDSSHIASATLRGAEATPPNRLVVAAWPSIYEAPWDYTTTSGQPITGDSAYAAYWNPEALSPGSSRTYVTYYGLADVTVDLTPPIALGLTGPASLATAGSNYTPNPFSVVATVSDDGTAPVDGATIVLNLPAGLHTSDPTTVNLGTLSPGEPEQLITWHVTADPQASATTFTYSVTASGTNTASKTLSRQIAVPALASPPPTIRRAVHLGDSYSAGEGAPAIMDGASQYIPGTNQSDNRCHRSGAAYGPLIDKTLDDSWVTSFHACSGALIPDFYTSFGSNHKDLLGNPANPAEIAQLDWLTKNTKLVTLTVGGNDVGFPSVITYCATRSLSDRTCEKLFGEDVQKKIANLRITRALQKLYREVKSRVASDAKVLVLGYPRFFPAKPPITCRTGVGFNLFEDNDMRWINRTIQSMDDLIRQAARDARVTFVPTYDMLNGHELCTRDPWMNRAIVNIDPWVRSGSFHPNLNGQRAYYNTAKPYLD
jgi:hypothetical protein